MRCGTSIAVVLKWHQTVYRKTSKRYEIRYQNDVIYRYALNTNEAVNLLSIFLPLHKFRSFFRLFR